MLTIFIFWTKVCIIVAFWMHYLNKVRNKIKLIKVYKIAQFLPSRDMPTAKHFFNLQYWQELRVNGVISHFSSFEHLCVIPCVIQRLKKPWKRWRKKMAWIRKYMACIGINMVTRFKMACIKTNTVRRLKRWFGNSNTDDLLCLKND